MRRPISAIAPGRYPAGRHRALFTGPSSLDWMILRMISLNSLAAFTQEVTRNAGIAPTRPVAASGSGEAARAPAAPSQRSLEAVPPKPGQILPRGSLLDLRV